MTSLNFKPRVSVFYANLRVGHYQSGWTFSPPGPQTRSFACATPADSGRIAIGNSLDTGSSGDAVVHYFKD